MRRRSRPGLHGLDRRVEHAGVADHVAVGVVDHDHVITLVLDGVDDRSVTSGALISGCRS
jgi:hypothetical protein